MAFIFVPNAEGSFTEGDKQTNPDTGVEYIYSDGAWRALGAKIEDEFGTLDERYLKLTGGELTGPLKVQQNSILLEKEDNTKQFKISPNSGDYFTNLYSYNSGGMRFRVAPDNTDSGYKTAISAAYSSHTVAGVTHPVETAVNWLRNPTQPHHAVNKAYVDETFAEAGAGSSELRPPGLRFKYQEGNGNPSNGKFKWFQEGGRRLNLSTKSQDFNWGTNMPRNDINYSEGHVFTIWVISNSEWKMKTTGTITRIDLHSDRMLCYVSYNADLNGSFNDTLDYYITIAGMF